MKNRGSANTYFALALIVSSKLILGAASSKLPQLNFENKIDSKVSIIHSTNVGIESILDIQPGESDQISRHENSGFKPGLFDGQIIVFIPDKGLAVATRYSRDQFKSSGNNALILTKDSAGRYRIDAHTSFGSVPLATGIYKEAKNLRELYNNPQPIDNESANLQQSILFGQ